MHFCKHPFLFVMLLSSYCLVLSSYHGFFVLPISQFSWCTSISSCRSTEKWNPKFVSHNNLPIRVLLETQSDRKWWCVCLGQADSNFGLDVSTWGQTVRTWNVTDKDYSGHRRTVCRGTEEQTLALTVQGRECMRHRLPRHRQPRT